MNLRPNASLRRALALLLLLTVAGRVVVPVCPEMAVRSTTAEHCEGPDGQLPPSHRTPPAPVDHHTAPLACAIGLCATMPVVLAEVPRAAEAGTLAPLFIPMTVSSAVPQVASPPPRT